jgi:hypothetical protein
MTVTRTADPRSTAFTRMGPLPPYLAALLRRLRRTCSTYVSSAATGGRPGGSSLLKVDAGPAGCFAIDDAREQALQQHRL